MSSTSKGGFLAYLACFIACHMFELTCVAVEQAVPKTNPKIQSAPIDAFFASVASLPGSELASIAPMDEFLTPELCPVYSQSERNVL